ncbi:hypothetical protein Fcan01_17420 [Folsomia candida]|uniref:Peptidase aspartic putative domain-containing protein n=2 Tax=Folsomia candida TaxID=158441 RepID=A0A226DV68_FOLCA|nr:hypothetical protein Fcan01_17420 [Folsomia candida]
MIAAENEVSELEQELELSEVKLISLQGEIATKTARLDSSHPLHEPNNIVNLKREIALLNDELSHITSQHNLLKVKTKRTVQRIENNVKVFKKQHQATIAAIDDDDEQYLGSDEDVDKELDTAAKRFERFKLTEPDHLPEQVKTTETSNVLEMIAKTLEKLSEKSTTSSSTDKMIIRQTIGRDLPYFGGRAEDWPAFIASYNRTTDACEFNDAENLERLRKCLKGEALKSVECLLVSPKSLPEVIEVLEQRFGQKEHIIRAMVAKARQIQPVKEDKPQTMVEFGSAVMNLTATIKSLGEVHHLQNPLLLLDLEEKLPASLRAQWKEKLLESAKVGSLENFTEWVKFKAKVATLMTPPRLTDEKKDKWAEQQPRKKEAVYNATDPESKKEITKICNECKKNHWTNECKKFMELSVDQRWENVKSWRAYFKCLSKGHSKEKCKRKKSCGVDGCNFDHHPLLHRPPRSREERGTPPPATDGPSSSSMNAGQGQTAGSAHHVRGNTSDKILMIVPVKIKGPKGVVSTHALLDNGSTLTLIDSDLAKQIGSSGRKTELCLQWIGSHSHMEDQSQTLTMEIQGVFPYAKWFEMKDVQTVQDFHCSSQTVIAQELKSKFPYLNQVPIKDMINVQPRLLIGVKNTKLIVPQRSVKGVDNNAVAHRTLLGWAIHGIMSGRETKGNVMHLCNRDDMDDLHNIVKNYFSVETFGVKVPDSQPQKKEDERAQEILEKTVNLVPGQDRYEIGHLYKDEEPSLVNSKPMAESRLSCAEKKMDRNRAAGSAHVEKINEYIMKGYARKLDPSEVNNNESKAWYLPHFVIDKPHKPEKYRLVFDAAAKIHGKSLNDYLLTGPDLLNSLASVIIKFRQNQIGFSGGIRDMFHQVRVRKEDLASQRFLWRGRDREKKPDVYQMEVLIFGGTSSPT